MKLFTLFLALSPLLGFVCFCSLLLMAYWERKRLRRMAAEQAKKHAQGKPIDLETFS